MGTNMFSKMMCLAGCGKAFHFGAVVSILDSHRRDPGSIPCNVTLCPNLEIVTQDVPAWGQDRHSASLLWHRVASLLSKVSAIYLVLSSLVPVAAWPSEMLSM
jgi:hypothetical protein